LLAFDVAVAWGQAGEPRHYFCFPELKQQLVLNYESRSDMERRDRITKPQEASRLRISALGQERFELIAKNLSVAVSATDKKNQLLSQIFHGKGFLYLGIIDCGGKPGI